MKVVLRGKFRTEHPSKEFGEMLHLQLKSTTESSRTKRIKHTKEQIQINKMRNEKGDIRKETEEIQKTISSYYKSLYSTKLENLDE